MKVILYVISAILGLTTFTAYAGYAVCPAWVTIYCYSGTYQIQESPSKNTWLANTISGSTSWDYMGGGAGGCTSTSPTIAYLTKAELKYLNQNGKVFSSSMPFAGKLRPIVQMACHYQTKTAAGALVNVGRMQTYASGAIVSSFDGPTRWTFSNNQYTCAPLAGTICGKINW